MTEAEQQRIVDEEVFRRKVQAAINATVHAERPLSTRIWDFVNSEIVKGVLISSVAIFLTAWIHSNEVERQEARQKAEKELQERVARAEKVRQDAILNIEKEVRYVSSFIEYIDKPGPKLELSIGLLGHLAEAKQVSVSIKALFEAIISKYGANPNPSASDKNIAQQAVRAIDLSALKQTQAAKVSDAADRTSTIASVVSTDQPPSTAVCRSRREAASPPRVYLHYSTRGGDEAPEMRDALDKECFLVPGIENVSGKATSPKITEIRMFNDAVSVLDEGAQIKAIIERAVPRLKGRVKLKYVNATWIKEPLPPRLFEVWFGTEE